MERVRREGLDAVLFKLYETDGRGEGQEDQHFHHGSVSSGRELKTRGEGTSAGTVSNEGTEVCVRDRTQRVTYEETVDRGNPFKDELGILEPPK